MRASPATSPAALGVSPTHRNPHDTGADRHVARGDMPQKQRTATGRRATVFEVTGNRTSGLWRQWQYVLPSHLGPGHAQGAFTPVNIIELKLSRLACAQAKVNKTSGHRIIASSGCSLLIKRLEELIQLRFGEHVRQAGKPPFGNLRNRCHQRLNAVAMYRTKPQIAA